MSLNSYVLNSTVVNGPIVYGTGAGQLVAISQLVVISGAGQLVSFAQNVELLITGQGLIATIAQKVQVQYSHEIISIVQSVQTQQFTTFLSRNRWYVQIFIDGYQIPDNQLTGKVSITCTEGDSATAQFTTIPGLGLQYPDTYEALPVQIYVTTYKSPIPVLVYGGQIISPECDVITRQTTFKCSTVRQNQINNSATLAAALPSIGYYTTQVFGNINLALYNGINKELTDRLTTVPVTLDFDPYGNWTVTNLLAKSSPDFTMHDADVYREDKKDPQIIKAAWSRMTNYVTIYAKYNFQRAYQREVSFNWTAPFIDSVCTFLEGSYTLPTRTLIQSAITAAKWQVNGNGITYQAPFASGFYNCGNNITLGYSTVTAQYSLQASTDALGNQQYSSNGTALYQSVETSQTNYATSLCMAAAWTAATRFTQNVEEYYTLIVQAPQSTNQYGQNQKFDNIGVTSLWNPAEWEKFDSYQQFPYGLDNVPVFGFQTYRTGIDQWANIDTYLPDFQTSQMLAISRAQTDIIKAHRDTRVIYNSFLHPEIQTVNTVYLNCTKLQAQGKVYTFTHEMDINTGEATTKVELVLSRAQGSASTDAIVPAPRSNYIPPAAVPTWQANFAYIDGQAVQPTIANGYYYNIIVAGTSAGSEPTWPIPPAESIGYQFYDNSITWSLAGLTVQSVAAVELQSHYGQPPPLPANQALLPTPVNGYITSPKWNGMIGNMYEGTTVDGITNYALTTYPVQFIVDTPAIETTVRGNAVIVAPTANYNVAIQNDLLNIYYEIP